MDLGEVLHCIMRKACQSYALLYALETVKVHLIDNWIYLIIARAVALAAAPAAFAAFAAPPHHYDESSCKKIA